MLRQVSSQKRVDSDCTETCHCQNPALGLKRKLHQPELALQIQCDAVRQKGRQCTLNKQSNVESRLSVVNFRARTVTRNAMIAGSAVQCSLELTSNHYRAPAWYFKLCPGRQLNHA